MIDKKKHDQQSESYRPKNRLLIILQPAPAWKAIIGLFLMIVLCLFMGAAPILILAFPIGSFAVGVFLYQRYPVFYVGFTWWIWFLTPLIRRLIDYKCGYITPFPIELTSILVTSISCVTFIKYFPKTYNRGGLGFTLCIATIVYAFLIGLTQKSIAEPEREFVTLLSWLSPICFGFNLFINWRDYPSYRQNIQNTFFWIVLITGIYGVLQFLAPPGWDRFYLLNQDNLEHLGMPTALNIRVFSTMTESVIFSGMLMPGLLLLIISQKKLALIAGCFGYLTFLLSQARTPWYSLLIAIIFIIFNLQKKQRIRLIIQISLIAILVLPLTAVKPFSEVITSRIETFSNLESDNSYRERIKQFNRSFDYVSSQFLGYGLLAPGEPKSLPASAIGTSTQGLFSFNDNGYFSLIVGLGLFGAITYIIGLLLLLYKIFKVSTLHLDIFIIFARAIALASLMRIMTANISYGSYAMPIWGFLGIAIAGQKYYAYQNLVEQNSHS